MDFNFSVKIMLSLCTAKYLNIKQLNLQLQV
jgi:hypothetical protein